MKELALETWRHSMLPFMVRGKSLQSSSVIIAILHLPLFFLMAESQEQWYNRNAIEQLALHIPFERDMASKAEQIEMLRGLVIRHGREMDPELFGFEARNELIRLGLWKRIGPEEDKA